MFISSHYKVETKDGIKTLKLMLGSISDIIAPSIHPIEVKTKIEIFFYFQFLLLKVFFFQIFQSQQKLIDLVIDLNLLPILKLLLTHSDMDLNTSAQYLIWRITNFGNFWHIESIINANILPLLVSLLINGSELDDKSFILPIITAFTLSATPDQVSHLFECNRLELICEFLT